ncbi:hypothetical protein OUZ56_009533 [Daphnia magna]|uniref:Uncharacterized protein n=1 Tax=Daphnia magna TaxID=35525 RepID=A0ABR0AGI3_9CRUS|nr:hypothetical protein OUZ56_009533 [Daphnia magna]
MACSAPKGEKPIIVEWVDYHVLSTMSSRPKRKCKATNPPLSTVGRFGKNHFGKLPKTISAKLPNCHL